MIATRPLIQQAIARTLREIEDPLGTCGFAHISANVLRCCGVEPSKGVWQRTLRDEAVVRLETLRNKLMESTC